FLQCLMRQVGRSQPDKNDKGCSLLYGIFDVRQCQVHGHIRTFANKLNGFSIMAHPGIVLIEVGCRVPGFKTVGTGAGFSISPDRAQVVLPEKSGAVPVPFKYFGDTLFLWPERMSPGKN